MLCCATAFTVFYSTTPETSTTALRSEPADDKKRSLLFRGEASFNSTSSDGDDSLGG